MSRWGETFAALSGGSDTLDTIRHSGDPLSIVSQSVNSVTAAPTPSGPSIPPAVDRALAIWGEAEAERAVIVGDEGAIPRIGIPEIPEEPVLLRDGRSLGSVATTARLIMIAQSRHLMPVLSATAALVLLTLSTLSQARATQSGTDVAPSTTKPEAPQPSYLEPLNADESPDAHRKAAPHRCRAHKMMDSRALRTFLPETAIKMVKSCHPRGGAREAGAADGVEIAANLDRRSMAAARARLVVRPPPHTAEPS